MTRRNLVAAREFGRLVQPVADLQDGDGSITPNDILMVIDVNPVAAGNQPKKLSITGLATLLNVLTSNVSARSATLVEPKTNDIFTLFKTERETTILEILTVNVGVAPVIDYEIYYDTERDGPGVLVASGQTTSVTDGDIATLQTSVIPGSTFVWIKIVNSSGVANELSINITLSNADTKQITVGQPQPNDTFTYLRTNKETTIAQITAVVAGIAPEVTYSVYYGAQRDAAGTPLVQNQVINNTSIGENAALLTSTVPPNVYVWVEIQSTSGIVEELSLTTVF